MNKTEPLTHTTLGVELKDCISPTASEIREGRLLKKIGKLTKQRDHYRELYEYYQKVISMQPYLEKRYQSYTQMLEERTRIKNLENRVKEQEQLIKLLNSRIDV
jgi:ppGpp synthetase/RelA/SpoT-type nucleotidyltranferase